MPTMKKKTLSTQRLPATALSSSENVLLRAYSTGHPCSFALNDRRRGDLCSSSHELHRKTEWYSPLHNIRRTITHACRWAKKETETV